MDALVENKPYNVNKQKMNGACHEAGTGERSGFQAFYGGSKEARVIHVHCQRRAPLHTARLNGTMGVCCVGQCLHKAL